MKALKFLKEVRSELGRITWPTRKEALSSTMVIIAACVVFGVFFLLIDAAVYRIIKLIIV